MGRLVKTPVLADVITDIFTGDDVTTVFTMDRSVSVASDVMIFIGGIHQYPGVAYTVDGSTSVTFSDPIPDQDVALVMHGYNQVS